MTLREKYPEQLEILCWSITDRLSEIIGKNKFSEINLQELELLKEQLVLSSVETELEKYVSKCCQQALLTILDQELDSSAEPDRSWNYQIFYSICDIFILVLEILHEAKNQYYLDELLGNAEKIISHVWEGIENLHQQKITTNLQLFLSFIKSLVKFCRDKEQDTIWKTIENLIFDIINLGEPSSNVIIIVQIFPLLRTDISLCEKMWKHISNSFEKVQNLEMIEKHQSAIVMLCCLCDFHFSVNPDMDHASNCQFKLHHEVLYWQAIHLGFLSLNPTTRKRAMYVMKRTVELCLLEQKSFAVNCQNSPKHFIFYWDASLPEAMTKLWNDFIIMLEVLEEKQAHVIKPILHKLDNWLQHSEETKNASFDFLTHPDWLWIICQRLITHENNFATRWITYWLLTKDFKQEDKFFSDSLIIFTSCHLLPALNDTSRYTRDQEDDQSHYPKIGGLLTNFFANLFGSEENNDNGGLMFLEFTYQLSQIQWGSVPLFYVTNALCSLPEKPLIGSECLKHLSELLVKVLRSQEPLLRSAIQCKILTLTLHLINSKDLTYTELSHFLAVFKQSESFKRGTAQWRDAVLWMQHHFLKSSTNINDTLTVNRALEFCKTEVEHLYQNDIPEEADFDSAAPLIVDKVECNRLARMIVLIGDATNASNFCWRDIFVETTEIMITAHSRAYMSGWKFDKAIQFLCSLLLEGKSYNTSEGLKKSVICQAVLRLIDLSTEDILGYLALKAINSKNVEELNLYTTTINTLLKQDELHSIIPTFVSRLTNIIRPILQNKFSIPHTFNAWRCLQICCSLAPECPQELTANTVSLISNIIQLDSIAELNSKPKLQCTLPAEKRLATVAMNNCWSSVNWYLTHQKVDGKTALHLAHLSSESLETGSHDVLIPVLKSLKHLLILIKSKTVVLDCLNISWNTCMEVKKNELFRPALKQFISTAFLPVLMSIHIDYLKSKAQEFYNIGEGANGIFNLLIDHCLSTWMVCDLVFQEIFPYLPMMRNAIVFGSVHRKDQRAVFDLCKYIASFEDKISTNVLVKSDHLSDPETRCLGMAFILHLSKENPEHVKIACYLAKELIDKDVEVTSERKRHFGNSYIHRVKNRAWQSILLLEHLLLEETCEYVLNVIYDTLAEESQQPSVRYLQEWFVTRCLHAHPNFLPDFILVMSKSAQKRTGCVASFLAIIVQLTKGLKKTDEARLKEFASLTLPWCMCQHFTTRIYAHVAFTKIWAKAEELKLENFTKDFKHFHDALTICNENGNATRNISQMLQDFYFRVFNPETDFNLETIFYTLPKLTKLASDEWIEPDLIAKTMVKLKLTQNIIPIFSHSSDLKSLEPGAWVAKSNSANSEATNSGEVGANFQKKITPWKQMVPDLSSYEDSFDLKTTGRLKSNAEGLIVVASLIDKAPNLGGLCRTCEVFGASEYVIGNLRYTEDKQFQSLSVTAEKWIDIKEVKPQNLKEYLLEMKQKGYILIGVEQTANSKILTNFTIPKKSLLLLGNEKQGLPVELIHLLDECVEIPQKGVIRSLNVHVSGAILIWEYARQHYSN